MAEDTRQTSSYNDEDSDKYTGMFASYSKSLGNAIDALKDAAKMFKTSADTNKETAEDLGASLKNFSTTFNKSSSDGASYFKEAFEDNALNMDEQFANDEKLYEKTKQSGQQFTSKLQAYGNAFLESAKLIISKIFSKFIAGFGRVVNNYQDSLYDITVRQQQTKSDYDSMMKGFTKEIRENDLTKQFSQIDWSTELKDVLSEGIRGDIAERMAYQNMISKKLIPAINTGSRAYMRASKVFGEDFQKGTTAISKFVEAQYGAEGLEEGAADNLLEILQDKLQTVVRENGGTKEDYQALWDQTLAKYGQMTDSLGREGADLLIDNLIDALSSNTANGNVVALQAAQMTGMSGGDFSGLTATSFADFMDAEVDVIKSMADGTNAQNIALGEAVTGYSAKLTDKILNSEYYGYYNHNQSQDELKNYNAKDVYDSYIKNLQNGEYQNVTDVHEKMIENFVSDIADTAARYIPYTMETLNLILEIIKKFFNAFIASKMLGSITNLRSGGGANTIGNASESALHSKLSGTFGGANSINGAISNGNAAAELMNEGASFSEVAAAGGKGSAILGKIANFGGAGSVGGGLLNLAAGPGALIAGGAMMAADAIGGFKAAKENGATTGQALGQTALGIWTGDTDGAITAQQQLDRVEEKGMIDWGQVGKNALKGGLVGAGVGTAVGGWAAGTGTLIGGAVGALTGAVASVTEQVIKYKDAQDYLNSSLGSMKERLDETTAALERSTKNQDAYVKTAKEYSSLQKQLKDATGEEKIVIQEKIDLLKEEIRLQLQDLGDAQSTVNEVRAVKADALESNDYAELFTQMKANFGGKNLDKLKDVDISEAKYTEDILATLGMTDKEAKAMVDQAVKAGYLNKETADKDYKQAFKKLIIDYGSANEIWDTNAKGDDLDEYATEGSGAYIALTKDNMAQTLENSKIATTTLLEKATSSYQRLRELASIQEDETIYDNAIVQEAIAGVLESKFALDAKGTGKTPIEDLVGYKTIDDYLKAAGYEDKAIKSYKDYISENGISTYERAKGWYRTGINKINDEEITAKLHYGETVLPRAAADTLRGLMGNNPIGVLNSGYPSKLLKSLSGSSISSDTSSLIKDLLKLQTDSIIKILSGIQASVQLIQSSVSSSSSSKEDTNSATVSYVTDAMVNYEGV